MLLFCFILSSWALDALYQTSSFTKESSTLRFVATSKFSGDQSHVNLHKYSSVTRQFKYSVFIFGKLFGLYSFYSPIFLIVSLLKFRINTAKQSIIVLSIKQSSFIKVYFLKLVINILFNFIPLKNFALPIKSQPLFYFLFFYNFYIELFANRIVLN